VQIFGILLLYSGFKTIANIDHYHLLLDEAPHNVAIALVVVGFAIFAVAFLGCCGAIKENACMLTSVSVHSYHHLVDPMSNVLRLCLSYE
jgi:CD63 antigen